MIDAPLTYCPACGAPGKTTYMPPEEDEEGDLWAFACGNGFDCGWEWNEVDHPITPRAVVEAELNGIPHLRSTFAITFGADLDPRTPMHAREIWRLAALKVGADSGAAMQALLKPISPSMDYTLWALHIGAEEVYFVGEAPTIEEATALLKGMLL